MAFEALKFHWKMLYPTLPKQDKSALDIATTSKIYYSKGNAVLVCQNSAVCLPYMIGLKAT